MKFKKPKDFPKAKQGSGGIIMGKIETELFIDQDNLNDELRDQPLLFRKYARLEAEAAKAVRAIELELDRTKAYCHIKISKENEKLKVADKEAMVKIDENVMQIEDELIDAMETHAEMKGILTAFRQRHDALKDLSANKRKELID